MHKYQLAKSQTVTWDDFGNLLIQAGIAAVNQTLLRSMSTHSDQRAEALAEQIQGR